MLITEKSCTVYLQGVDILNTVPIDFTHHTDRQLYI